MPLRINKPNLNKTSTSLVACGVLAIALLGASIGFASPAAQFDPPAVNDDRNKESHVGTYELPQVFQRSHYADTLTRQLAPLQAEAQQAQQEGDHQRMMEIEAQAQTMQNEVVEAFLADLEEAVPRVASEAGIKVVALDVVWIDPELGEAQDLSGELVAQINANADADEDAPQAPFDSPQ